MINLLFALEWYKFCDLTNTIKYVWPNPWKTEKLYIDNLYNLNICIWKTHSFVQMVFCQCWIHFIKMSIKFIYYSK